MSEPTDAEREQAARDRAEKFKDEQLGTAAQDRAFLLRLLDAERARADAAEAKVARVRGFAEMSAIAARATGNGSEERTILDVLHLLDR